MSQLKEQNGKYYKQCQVVMLATESSQADIRMYMNEVNYKLASNFTAFDKRTKYSEVISYQHLYILSDEKIKKDDWLIHINSNTVYKNVHGVIGSVIGSDAFLENECKKIIATTDKSLTTDGFSTQGEEGTYIQIELPQPSQSFIKAYIEKYNEGTVITDVLVEYKVLEYRGQFDYSRDVQLKVDSDNTITITKLKDSYSRAEVEKLLSKLFYANGGGSSYTKDWGHEDLETWIKENL